MKPSKTRLDHLGEFDLAPEWARFNQKTVAAVRDCSEALLERDRWAGTGIPFIRDGRSIRYVKRDVLDYLAQQTSVQSTSQADAARMLTNITGEERTDRSPVGPETNRRLPKRASAHRGARRVAERP